VSTPWDHGLVRRATRADPFRLAIVAGLSLAVVGCGSTRALTVTQTRIAKRVVHRKVVVRLPPRHVVKRRIVVVHPRPLSYGLFAGSYFSIEYPDTWRRETSEASKGSYLDTTIRSDENSNVMLRVDVTPNAPSDAATSARKIESALVQESGYRELRFTPVTYGPHSGIAWEFIVTERGVPLRKVDVFLDDDYGDGFAVLTQAPVDEYSKWQAVLSHIRHSLLINR
jgi:hypothetical protein